MNARRLVSWLVSFWILAAGLLLFILHRSDNATTRGAEKETNGYKVKSTDGGLTEGDGRGGSAPRSLSGPREIRLSNAQLEHFLDKMGRTPDALAFVELIRNYSLDNPLDYLEELRTHPLSAKSPIACLLLTTRLEEPADRLAWAQRFTALEPENRLAKLALAKALGETGRSGEALERLKEASELQSESHETEFVRNFDGLGSILPEEELNLLVFQSGNRWHNQIDVELFGGLFGAVDFWSNAGSTPEKSIESFSSCYSLYKFHQAGAGKYGAIRGTSGYGGILKALGRAPEKLSKQPALSSLSALIRRESNEQVTRAIEQKNANSKLTAAEISEKSLDYRSGIK